MFRDIGDKLGVIRGEIGLAKCLVQMKQYKEAMNYYQLAVKGSHAAGNKVFFNLKVLTLLAISHQFYALQIYLSPTKFVFMKI